MSSNSNTLWLGLYIFVHLKLSVLTFEIFCQDRARARDSDNRARQEIDSVDREFLHAFPRNGMVVDGVVYSGEPLPPNRAHAALGYVATLP